MGGVRAIAVALWACMGFFSSALHAAPQLVTLYSFMGGSDGGKPATSLAYDPTSGLVYGVTPNISVNGPHCAPDCGTLFSFNATTHLPPTLLHPFAGQKDGANPQGALLLFNGVLYGTTEAGGVYDQGILFAYTINTNKFAVLHNFAGGSDGAAPLGQLTPTPDGDLLGTTSAGGLGGCGASGCGTVFKVTKLGAKHPKESVIYAFQGNEGNNGNNGTGDGRLPQSPLIFVNKDTSVLFGSTVLGGQTTAACPNGCGTVFKVDPMTGAESVVYQFQGGPDGIAPQGLLVSDGSNIYGTTSFGGNNICSFNNQPTTCGTFFSVPASNGERFAQGFGNENGGIPVGGLCVHRGAQIEFGYGPTASGGVANLGTLFSARLGPSNAPTVIYNFSGGVNGQTPLGGLTQVAGGGFFGTTSAGGTPGCGNGCGTIFMLRP